MNTIRRIAAALLLAAPFTAAHAVTTSYSGSFADPGNAALAYSDLTAAQFTDVNAIANNVALYAFSVPVTELVTFTSSGYAAGGADPYFSLFTRPVTAGAGVFLLSNVVSAQSTGGDFTLSTTLAAGNYQFALGVNQNMSFAENLGTGTLADGFVQLGDPNYLGNSTYALSVTMPVPEPAGWQMLMAGAVMLVLVFRRKAPA